MVCVGGFRVGVVFTLFWCSYDACMDSGGKSGSRKRPWMILVMRWASALECITLLLSTRVTTMKQDTVSWFIHWSFARVGNLLFSTRAGPGGGMSSADETASGRLSAAREVRGDWEVETFVGGK